MYSFEPELEIDEVIEWIGMPHIKAYIRRNVKELILNYCKILLVTIVFFLLYYLLLSKPLFPPFDVSLLKCWALAMAMVKIFESFKMIKFSKEVSYFVTNLNIYIHRPHKAYKTIVVNKHDILKVKIVRSAIDDKFGVSTIKINFRDSNSSDFHYELIDSLYIESIPDSDKVFALIKKVTT